MAQAYNETYLYDAMRNLGEMTEYAHDACGVDPDLALKYFIISGYADYFAAGNPRVVCGLSGTELFKEISKKCGADFDVWPEPLTKYTTEEYYWIGYILAYFQWHINKSFKAITEIIKPTDLIRMYPSLHTVSEEHAIEVIDDLYRKKSQFNRLQEYRKRMGMTQSQLASASGVNLRTLQQYEIGSKDLSKAAAESVVSLSEVLHCKPEDLI
ncbi:MAG: helix-turn-helix transcriptional regulator [Lachnospiraceae bacterium]|nr:helix-turn-helix transcriptional regulator [Lachnospiraceae bacterium]